MKGPKIENIRDLKWVGRRIWGSYWESSYWVEIIATGRNLIFVRTPGGEEQTFPAHWDWYEWVYCPFEVGDFIIHRDRPYVYEVRTIEEDGSFIGVRRFTEEKTFVKEAIEDLDGWELYQEPKKKKTVAFGLLNSKNLPVLTYNAYESRAALDAVVGKENVRQFPAVTKDGTVLEFEVDDW